MPPQLWDESHPGIYIINDKPRFFHTCGEALNKIRSQPVGAGLLKTIASKCLFSRLKVFINECITSSTDPLADGKGGSPWRRACGWLRSENTFEPGEGASCSIGWEVSDNHPEGNRPAFLGLAHELIHALYNLHGLVIRDLSDADADGKYGMLSGVTTGKAVDEARVTGLGRFADEPFSENAIRKEHGIAPRRRYVVNGHDVAKLDIVSNGKVALPHYLGKAEMPI